MAYERKLPDRDPCPVEEVLGLVGGKWKARLVHELSFGPVELAGLRRAIPVAASQVLIVQLDELIAADLVVADTITRGSRRSRVYRLTDKGVSLLPVLDTVAAWGQTRLSERGETWSLARRRGPSGQH